MSATANIKLVGTSSLTEIDSGVDNALFIEARPPATGGIGGAYSVTASASINVANLGSFPNPNFTFRWTHPTTLCLIQRVSINMVFDTTYTLTSGNAIMPLQVCAMREAFLDPDTDSSTVTKINVSGTSNDQKYRTSFPPTQISSRSQVPVQPNATSNIEITGSGVLSWAETANLLTAPNYGDVMHGPTLVNLAMMIANFESSAAGTWPLGNTAGLFPLLDYTGVGMHPLVLSKYEGFAIFFNAGVTATGTFQEVVQVEWMEVPTY